MKLSSLKSLLVGLFLLSINSSVAQIIPNNGSCDLPLFEDWSTGSGANPCACKWKNAQGWVMCSYGNCGNSEFQDCISDCVSGQAAPSGWYQGGGNYGSDVCAIQLPIGLALFEGKAYGRRVDLVWETATETNNSYFEVYYSNDLTEFEKLVEIDGAGTSLIANKYMFMHQMVVPGVHYYKLRQVDFDGQYTESNVIAIDNRQSTENSYFSSIYPNPTNDQFNFTYLGNDFNSPIEVLICGLDGKILDRQMFTSFGNHLVLSMNLGDYKNGVYWINIYQNNTAERKKLVIVK